MESLAKEKHSLIHHHAADTLHRPKLAAWLKRRSCWCLTSPPGLQRGRLWLTNTIFLCAGDWALPWKDVHGAEIPELIMALVSSAAALKKKKRKKCIVFSKGFMFSACTMSLPSLDYFAHWVAREISGVTRQDSKMRSCHILPGSFSSGQEASAGWDGCEPRHRGMSEGLVILNPAWGAKGGGVGEGLSISRTAESRVMTVPTLLELSPVQIPTLGGMRPAMHRTARWDTRGL